MSHRVVFGLAIEPCGVFGGKKKFFSRHAVDQSLPYRVLAACVSEGGVEIIESRVEKHITNNGEEYVSAFLKNNGLHCAGIVCGDMVKAYKPRKELFGKALEISGCDSHEVIHVGDSLQSDVQGAMSVGIKACLLDRKAANTPANTQEGYVVCSSLTETLTLL